MAKFDRFGGKRGVALWALQFLLAGLFLFAGYVKLVMPFEALASQSALPVWFLRFIGACELVGAVGLILPGLFRIQQWLTPLAASGLVIIMIGATMVTAATGPVASALFPLIVGLLALLIATKHDASPLAAGRWHTREHQQRSQHAGADSHGGLA